MSELQDPLPSYSFLIEIDNVVEAGFTACSGLNAKREVWTHQEGGYNDFTHIRLGKLSYGNITLKHGVVFSDKLWQWFLWSGKVGVEKRKLYFPVNGRYSIAIIQCVPYEGKRIRQYDLEESLPISWTGPDLDTGSDVVAVESLEIAISRFTIQDLAKA